MKYRRFGRTGLQVSEMAFGGGFVGGIVILADDDTKRAAIRRALDAGVNWIDTAPLYGQGRSEEALGWLLDEVDEKPHVSTKVGLDLERLDDIGGQIEASLHQSLTRLKRDSVDLLQLHNQIGAETGAGALGIERVLGAGGAAEGLERMRAQGLTRFVGLTVLGEAEACRRAIDSGRFDSAQVYYNLLNPSAARPMPARWSGHDFSGVMAACAAHDVAVMNIRVFAGGAIPTDQRHGREIPLTQDSAIEVEEQRVGAVFAVLGETHGSRAQTAIRFALANPDTSCVVVGLGELDHVDEALAGFAAGPLPGDAVAALDAVYADNFGIA